MLYDSLPLGSLTLKNRLVLPPMQTDRSSRGHVTDALLEYYRDRAQYSAPGLIITEHCCVTEAGRADEGQLSLAEDALVSEHRELTRTIHDAGSRVIVQISHAGSAAEPFDDVELVSAWELANPRKKLTRPVRPLSVSEIHALEEAFVRAALRAAEAGYDGAELHSAHGYLFNQFYSPLTNRRTDEYGAASVESRCRFLLETAEKVRAEVGRDLVLAVRLGGADYMPGGSTEEDAAEACRLLSQAGVQLLDISGGMCGFVRAGHTEPGYFSSMTEKIKSAVSVPVLLTGGVTTLAQAEALLAAGKADLIGVGRALYKDPHWAENQ